MKILSHRGYWKKESEKNSKDAIERSIKNGFGFETDIRDSKMKLVISHNPPSGNEDLFEEILKIYISQMSEVELAINIKSDGLDELLESLLVNFNIKNYFVFDMSVPDTVNYISRGLKFFCRQSEQEMVPSFYFESDGVWMDQFTENWINETEIAKHLDNGKRVALVSPELHNQEYEHFWKMLLDSELYKDERVLLCTDYPAEANRYFYGVDSND